MTIYVSTTQSSKNCSFITPFVKLHMHCGPNPKKQCLEKSPRFSHFKPLTCPSGCLNEVVTILVGRGGLASKTAGRDSRTARFCPICNPSPYKTSNELAPFAGRVWPQTGRWRDVASSAWLRDGEGSVGGGLCWHSTGKPPMRNMQFRGGRLGWPGKGFLNFCRDNCTKWQCDHRTSSISNTRDDQPRSTFV